MAKRFEPALIGGLLLLYAVLAAAYAVRVPPWLAPDEPAHYNYAAQVAQAGCCPQITAGDWNQAYLALLTGADFAPQHLGNLMAVQYEDHQPPLFYVLASALIPLSGGGPLALRLFSAVIGAGVVLCAYAAGAALVPGRPAVRLGAAAIVALVPQHLHILASVNNDGLAELLIGLALWRLFAVAAADRAPTVSAAWVLGLLVGLGLLTKLSALFLAGLVPLGLAATWAIHRWRKGGRPAELIALLAAFAVPVALTAGIWWARNIGVYGFPDLFGLRAHDAVVVGQPRTAEALAALGVGGYIRALTLTTFQSFWGQFGWMELPMPTWTYAAIGAFLATCGLGWLVGAGGLAQPTAPGRRLAWGLAGLAVVLALAQFAYYNTSFQQFQGRYIYPGLIPLAVMLASGLDALWRVVAGRLGWRGAIAAYGAAALPLCLAGLNAFVLWRVIPGLAPF